VPARIIDLSRAAAEALDMLAFGMAPVRVEQVPGVALGPLGGAWPAPAAPAMPAPFAPPPITAPDVISVDRISAPSPVSPVPVAPAVLLPVPAAPAPVMVDPFVAHVPAPEAVSAPFPVAQGVAPVAPVAQTMFQAPAALIRGRIPEPGSANLYRLQVGSYSIPRNAVVSFERLRDSGLSPAYERYGNFYRVVLAGLRAADIPIIAQILGNAGFREAIIRQETGY
jgi:hypothetical protein